MLRYLVGGPNAVSVEDGLAVFDSWMVVLFGTADEGAEREILRKSDLLRKRSNRSPSKQRRQSKMVEDSQPLDPQTWHSYWLNRRGAQLFLAALSEGRSLLPNLEGTGYEIVSSADARQSLWPWVESMIAFIERAAEPGHHVDRDAFELCPNPASCEPPEAVGIDPRPQQNSGGSWVPWQVDLAEAKKRGGERFIDAASRHKSVADAKLISPRDYFWQLVGAHSVDTMLTMFGTASKVMPDWASGSEEPKPWTPDEARAYLHEVYAEDLIAFLVAGNPFEIERSDPRTAIPMADDS
jgi:hypothetical protein